MQRGTVGIVQPISRIEREQLDLSAFGEGGRLIEHQASTVNPCFDRHQGRLASDLPPNKRLQPAASAVSSR